MSTHRLLTSAALRIAGVPAAAAAAPAIVPAPTPTPAPAASTEGQVDVVTVADAQAAIAEAEMRGATAERTRTAAVFASDAGKANAPMAAFMLNANPAATADAIVAQLAAMPAAAAPAAAPAAAAPAPAAPAAAAPAITTPLAQTPRIEPGPAANTAETGGTSQAEIDKLWDTAITGAAATNSFGADLAPGIPRTGN